MQNDTTNYINNRGHKIAFDSSGSGPAVVLLHGWIGNRSLWHLLGYVAALQNEFTVITLDARAHGESGIPSDPDQYQRSDLASDVIAVLDHLDVERAHILGHSMGAYIGVGVLAGYPHRVRSLAIGGWDPASVEETLKNSAIPIEDVLPYVKEIAPWITEAHVPGLDAIRKPMGVQDIPVDVLSTSGLPLLFWSGTEDPVCTAVEALASDIPQADFFSVSGDHMGSLILDVPNTIDKVRQFFLNNSRDSVFD